MYIYTVTCKLVCVCARARTRVRVQWSARACRVILCFEGGRQPIDSILWEFLEWFPRRRRKHCRSDWVRNWLVEMGREDVVDFLFAMKISTPTCALAYEFTHVRMS